MGWIIVLSIWVICGVLAYGLIKHDIYTSLDFCVEAEDKTILYILSAAGPIGLAVIILCLKSECKTLTFMFRIPDDTLWTDAGRARRRKRKVTRIISAIKRKTPYRRAK